jgi:hypothetical protein
MFFLKMEKNNLVYIGAWMGCNVYIEIPHPALNWLKDKKFMLNIDVLPGNDGDTPRSETQ